MKTSRLWEQTTCRREVDGLGKARLTRPCATKIKQRAEENLYGPGASSGGSSSLSDSRSSQSYSQFVQKNVFLPKRSSTRKASGESQTGHRLTSSAADMRLNIDPPARRSCKILDTFDQRDRPSEAVMVRYANNL